MGAFEDLRVEAGRGRGDIPVEHGEELGCEGDDQGPAEGPAGVPVPAEQRQQKENEPHGPGFPG